MKKSKLIDCILLIAAVVLILIPTFRMWDAWEYNDKVKSEFVERDYGENDKNAKYNPYKMKVPMEEMNIKTALSYTNRVSGIAGGGPGYYLMTLPIDVKYYSSTRFGAIPKLVIPKGTKVFVYPEAYDRFKPYGLDTIPTYEHGWRYAAPLIEAGADTWYEWDDWSAWQYDLNANPEYYYIRTADVIKLELYFRNYTVADLIGYTHNYLSQFSDRKKPEVIAYTWEEARDKILTVDCQLYENGAYISPDLMRPYFDTLNIILLSAGGALLIAHIGARGYLRRKRNDS